MNPGGPSGILNIHATEVTAFYSDDRGESSGGTDGPAWNLHSTIARVTQRRPAWHAGISRRGFTRLLTELLKVCPHPDAFSARCLDFANGQG
jgi:hypothetical protein